MPNTISDWGAAVWSSIAAGMATLFAFLPALIGALVLFLIGWAIARILAKLTDRGLDALHFDSRMERVGVTRFLDRANVRMPPSNMVASLVKWFVILLTLLVVADALGLTQINTILTGILAYIPNVIAAIIILAIGVLLADFVQGLVRGTAGSAGMGASDLLGTVAYWGILVFAILGALSQLHIAPDLMQTLYTALIGSVALAAAIAFGLGLRDQAAQVVAGRNVLTTFRMGDVVNVANVEGQIEHVGATSVLLRTERGLISVPAHWFTDQIVTIRREAALGGGPEIRGTTAA